MEVQLCREVTQNLQWFPPSDTDYSKYYLRSRKCPSWWVASNAACLQHPSKEPVLPFTRNITHATSGKNTLVWTCFAGSGPRRCQTCRQRGHRPAPTHTTEIWKVQTPVPPSHFVTMFLVMSNVTFKPNYAGIFIILCLAIVLGYLRNFTDEWHLRQHITVGSLYLISC